MVRSAYALRVRHSGAVIIGDRAVRAFSACDAVPYHVALARRALTVAARPTGRASDARLGVPRRGLTGGTRCASRATVLITCKRSVSRRAPPTGACNATALSAGGGGVSSF